MRTVSNIVACATAALCLSVIAAVPAVSQERGASAAPGSQTVLVRQLEAAIAAAGWDGDRWSVLVMSLDAGDTLFSHRADAAVMPASNLKLFTTAAALYFLGADYRYSTYLTGTGPIRGGVLEGDLYLYGTGDPAISDRFFDGKLAVWEALADSLAATGVTRIAGDLVGDASYFEGRGVGLGWQPSYITHTYAAPSSALAFNDNVVTLRMTAADEAGAPAQILFVPGGTVDLQNETVTTTSGRSHVEVVRESYDAPIVLRGNVRQGSSALWRAVPLRDPGHYAATVLAEVLEKRGIRLDGQVRSLHAAGASLITGQKVFAPATDEDPVIQVLAIHRSPPLQEILTVINQRSHNQFADAVLRTVGRVAAGRGSAEGGEAAVRALLDEAGSAGAVVRMDDGSGLSTHDRASARALVEILAFMDRSPWGEAYRATLPEAATDRGLRRMSQTPAAGNLRAKTGTIDRVSALSGYVTSETGERLAFAILANDVPSTWTAKRVEDRIGARLAALQRPIPSGRLAEGSPGPGDRPDASGPESGDTAAAKAAARAESAGARAQAEDPASIETGTRVAQETVEPEPEESAGTSYVIRSGDTLDGIARRNDTSVRALQDANPGVNPRRLIPGRSITIPVSSGNGG